MKFLNLQWLVSLACLCASVASAQPTLNLDRSAGPARLWLNGDTNRYYMLEGASGDLSNWDFLLTLRLTNQTQNWFDADSMLMPRRIYRAGQLAVPPPVEVGNDFRLVDHLGRSRSLYYFLNATNMRAFVLIFAGNGCVTLQDLAPTIRALTNKFTPQGVTFWLIDSNLGVTRSNILAEATALGFGNGPPILHDPAQIVARSYRASTAPEAIALKRTVAGNVTNMTAFYRGAIDDRLGSNAVGTTQFYLSNALTSFLAGTPITTVATRPGGCDITFAPATPVTYSDDVAPILLDKCVRCHSAGNIAPFSFNSYSSVQARSIKMHNAILKGGMPPWHADSNYGAFANNSSLTPEQAAKIVQWIDEGSPRGGGPDPLVGYAPPVDYPVMWPVALGTPDFVITLPTQSIPASGVLSYRYITNVYSGPTTWLRAAIVLPGTLSVLHHVLVSEGSDNFVNSFFAGYVPGTEPLDFPAGTGKQVISGQTFVSQMHYISAGRATSDVTRIGFYFMASPPTAPLIQSSAANIVGWAIPPGAFDYQTTAQSAAFTKAVDLYDMSPHMHLRGSRFKYEAVYPAGHVPARETLLSVPSYDFAWQTPYRLAQPKRLPAGTSILCTGAWDNSYLNPNNPSPSATVTFGEQTFNEMFIGFFTYSEVP